MTYPIELTTPREIIAALRKPGKAFVNVFALGGTMVEVVKADVITELRSWPQDQKLSDDQCALLWNTGNVSL